MSSHVRVLSLFMQDLHPTCLAILTSLTYHVHPVRIALAAVLRAAHALLYLNSNAGVNSFQFHGLLASFFCKRLAREHTSSCSFMLTSADLLLLVCSSAADRRSSVQTIFEYEPQTNAYQAQQVVFTFAEFLSLCFSLFVCTLSLIFSSCTLQSNVTAVSSTRHQIVRPVAAGYAHYAPSCSILCLFARFKECT